MTVIAKEGMTWTQWLGRLNLHDARAEDIDYINHLQDLITRIAQLIDSPLDDVRVVGSRAIGLITTPDVCLGNEIIAVCLAQDPASLNWVVSIKADHVVYKHFLGRLKTCPDELLVNIPTYWHFEPFSSKNRRNFTGLVSSDYDLYAFLLILFSDKLSKPE